MKNFYFVVTPKGYTKHYYNGSQRLASVVGDIEDLPDGMIVANASERLDNDTSKAYMHSFVSEDTLLKVQVYAEENMLYPVLSKEVKSQENYNLKDNTYYYHSDHLGSATWITDGKGDIIEHRRYLPYGETWYEKRFNTSTYVERFRFTGKERDDESGYDYFGARYFDAMLLTSWLSVDPLAGKYPYMNPYAYCEGNPMKFVDPDGKGPKDRVILAQELAEQKIPYNQDKSYDLRTATSPEALATMDCSEFVCRVMAGDGITSTIESHSTSDMLANMMSDETKFVKSDIPQAGDIVLWNGHTGIVESYNEKNGKVTVLHATQYKKDDGTIVNSTCRERYSLNGYYRDKKNAFFYRPVNETPDVFENSSTQKLPEVIVKPSNEDTK